MRFLSSMATDMKIFGMPLNRRCDREASAWPWPEGIARTIEDILNMQLGEVDLVQSISR